MSTILIVDDETGMRRILASNLRRERYDVVEAAGVDQARMAIAQEPLDAVITDQKMHDGEGLEVLAAVRDADATLSVVFLTAFATVELAVESMRRGAFDFITKPFMPEVLMAAVRRAVERTRLLRENERLRNTVVTLEGSPEIKGHSPAIADLLAKIGRVAATNATVLITGETGSGKELVARAIHRSSNRTSRPFIAVNCAAFTDTLLESQLFGHERGAFTGADRAREGLFEAAHEGVLFLDEVGDMSMMAQAKLLRVLTDGLVTRLGSTRPRRVDVRLLVATHRDLRQRVRDGLFRDDLYYRMAVVPLPVPPLRDRREDIPELCDFFLEQVARDLKVMPRRISADAMRVLLSYDFPGNVRELRNLIERACILSVGDQIGAESFPVDGRGDDGLALSAMRPRSAEDVASTLPESLDLRPFLADLEKALIRRALKETRGAQAEAARKLGLSRSDLSYKLDKYGMRDSVE
jgi:two-component system, NtrC family, response regulator HydG